MASVHDIALGDITWYGGVCCVSDSSYQDVGHCDTIFEVIYHHGQDEYNPLIGCSVLGGIPSQCENCQTIWKNVKKEYWSIVCATCCCAGSVCLICARENRKKKAKRHVKYITLGALQTFQLSTNAMLPINAEDYDGISVCKKVAGRGWMLDIIEFERGEVKKVYVEVEMLKVRNTILRPIDR